MLQMKLLALFCFIAAYFSLTINAADDIQVDDPDVVKLTEDNFDDFINQDLALVEFYAPWCGHCKSLAPEYAQAATELKKNSPPIPIGKVDATVQSSLASRYSVSGYPTLKVFRNGKDFEYKAPGSEGRKKSGIVKYMQKQVGPSIKSITNEKELEAFIVHDKSTRYAVVAFFNSDKVSQLQSSFSILANKLRDDFGFGKVLDNTALLRKYVPDSSITEAIVAFSYGEPIVYEGSPKQSNLEEFIRSNSVPLVGEITDENAQLYQQRNLPIAKFVMKVDKNFNSKHMKYYTNRFKKIAETFKNQVIVAVADRTGQKQLVETFNLGSDEEVSLVIEDGSKKYKYEPEDDKKIGKVDVNSWMEWIDKVVKNSAEIKQYVRSERTPKDNNGPVKIVTGNNFNEIVNDPNTDLLIEFYAPWCGHCKSLEPKYNELGSKVKSTKGLTIAKIDATANDFDREKYQVSGYPTIYFRPMAGKSGKLPSPVKYEGAREVDDFMKYLKENAKSMKKKNKKKKKKVEVDDDEDDD